MQRFLLGTVLGLSLIVTTVANSQDNLPAAGQSNGQEAGAGQGQRGGQQVGKNVVARGSDAEYAAQVGYALGRNFGMQLKENQIECDMNSLMAGMNDALRGAQPKWTDEQLDAVMQRFTREMQQRAKMRMQQDASKNQQEEAAFLAQNAKREGVQTLPSGLQYRVIQQGQGASPTLRDHVKCNYRGTLLNGTEFDNSARHGGPAEFGVSEVIKGWTEALQKMHVGDKWQLFVPAKLAYGMNPPPGGPIEAGSMLVFEIELLDVAKQ